MPKTPDIDEVRWAGRVNPSKIRALYESDARGRRDDDLVEDVGLALYARSRSILEATQAHAGRVVCPRCRCADRETILTHSGNEDDVLHCDICGWQAAWGEYLKTYQHKHLHGGGAVPLFQNYLTQYDAARDGREKLIAIDRLIHTFHWEMVKEPGRSVGKNLIYGRNTEDVLKFLDTLTYGAGSTPEMIAERVQWKRKLAASQAAQEQKYVRKEEM